LAASETALTVHINPAEQLTCRIAPGDQPIEVAGSIEEHAVRIR